MVEVGDEIFFAIGAFELFAEFCAWGDAEEDFEAAIDNGGGEGLDS